MKRFILSLILCCPVYAVEFVVKPVVQYKMNDIAASSVVIESIILLNGVYRTDAASVNVNSVPGQIKRALQFNRSSQFVKIPDNAIFDIATTLSVCVWAKNDAADIGQQAMAGKFDDGKNKREWVILLTSGQKLAVIISPLGTAAGISVPIADDDVVTETGTEINEWHFYCFTIDTSGGAVTPLLYLDGVSIDRTDAGVAVATINNNDTPVSIGGVFSSGSISDLWGGALDNFLIFDRALTSSEVLFLWNDGNGREDFANDADLTRGRRRYDNSSGRRR